MLLNISNQKQKIYPIMQSFRGNQTLPNKKTEQDSFVSLTSEEIIENFKKIKDGYEERYYDDYTLDNLRLRSVETQRNLLRLAQLKDINNCLYFDSNDLSNISFRSDEFIKNIVLLTQMKDERNDYLINSPTMSGMVIGQSDEAVNKFCKLLQEKDENGKPLFRVLPIASMLSHLDDKKVKKAIELAKIKTGEKRVFGEATIYELIAEDDKTINNAIKLATLTDENGDNIFWSDIAIRLAKEDEKVQNSAQRLALLKDKNNNILFRSGILYRLAKKDENIQNKITLLASNIKKDGMPLFDDNALMKLIEEKENVLDKIIALTEFKDEDGECLFSAYEIIRLTTLDKEKQQKAQKLAKLKNKKGKRILRNELLIGLLDRDKDAIKNAIKLSKLKDKYDSNLLSDNAILLLLDKSPEAQFNTQRFVNLISHFKYFSFSDREIKRFIIKDEQSQELIISLAEKKDSDASPAFSGNEINECLARSYEELLGMHLLADIKDKRNKRLFTCEEMLSFTEKLYENDKKIDFNYIENLRCILQKLKVEYFDSEEERMLIAEFFTQNDNMDLSALSDYIDAIDLSKIYEVAPQLKNYSASELLNFYSYHYANGRKTSFEAQDLALDDDLTQYLKENYLNGKDLSILYDALPLTTRKVGEIPNDWLEKVNKKDKKKAIDKIYRAIENFRLDESEEELSKKLEEILNKKVKISYIDEGTFGKCYKISIENAKDYCLKIFKNNLDINSDHGAHVEVQNALIANNYSDEYVKFYFGKVAPKNYADSFLITQFLSDDIKTEQTRESWNQKYIIYNTDTNVKNQINDTFIDFGGILVIEK